MAVTIPFDTLDYARKLESAGVPAAQAELQATALGEALTRAVAAPADLVMLESWIDSVGATLEARIDSVAATLGARIDSVAATLGARIDSVAATLGARIDSVAARIDRLTGAVDNMKWMFGFVAALNIGMLVRLLLVR
ncbi:MAG TPA: hypothetical protein VF059_00255 [Casimicrobiaceae bacterium]